MFDLVFPLLLGTFFAVIFVALRYRFRKLAPAWNAVAQKRGLRFSLSLLSGEPKLDGVTHGQGVRVRARLPRGQTAVSGATIVSTTFAAPLPLNLKLSSQNEVQSLLKLVGKTDHELGDRAFDHRIVTGGANRDDIVAFLTPERREKILHLFQASSSARLDRKGLRSEVPGTFLTELALDEAVEACLEVGRVLQPS